MDMTVSPSISNIACNSCSKSSRCTNEFQPKQGMASIPLFRREIILTSTISGVGLTTNTVNPATATENRANLEGRINPNLAVGLSAPTNGAKGVLTVMQKNVELVLSEEDLVGSSFLDYGEDGPFEVRTAYKQEHTCAACFPDCVAGNCLLKINVTYPKQLISRNNSKTKSRHPLAIFSSGFLVESGQYQSYARHLASWGFVALTYDKTEGLMVPLDDLICSRFISELIDWAATNRLMRDYVDTESVYLCGHSRGGKVSVLAAAQDPRVAAICLIDPVDNTVYAPLAPGYPSAVEALQAARLSIEKLLERDVSVNKELVFDVPIAVVGGGLVGDCAPPSSNYSQFYQAASPPAWEIVIRDAAHFQFVDSPSMLQNAICGQGSTDSEVIRYCARAAMVAWGHHYFLNKARRPHSDIREKELVQEMLSAIVKLSKRTSIDSKLKLI